MKAIATPFGIEEIEENDNKNNGYHRWCCNYDCEYNPQYNAPDDTEICKTCVWRNIQLKLNEENTK